ncbi:oxygen-independent coproporphyrinogen III oxidase [Nitrospirillum viridazoti]|uniref:Coproporphyrinogen-III oxidase n=1 Tax=Nitrospirillum viridazoti CBAmc TaxID=1441467 RepID=A0A248JRT1_9PROT|nr:oxygen-independent coproporphyrinogen III oxidase [Nitrospirillum amazonense]ASG21319.1 oxygen-independent coproporphyrinogen III oxidase [Nitrospirillum amazonense CBAmc]TWB32986.1 oxygen-independent coproporphyrinogen-3 oxidase [Nitrospirillum amazonense]
MRPDLVAKYRNQRVPRYTSYPPSPQFSAAVTADDYRRWLGQLTAADTLSLYLHVPFCRSMCWYCGCHTTVVNHEAPIRRYQAALEAEIDAVAGALVRDSTLSGGGGLPPVTHIHFGGGTPTLLPPDAFQSLMDRLAQRFGRPAATAEIAVEIDPRTLTPAMAAALGQGGVTRASLGVQSFDDRVQRAINRIQPYAATAEAVARLRQAGIGGINLDLIYGLPHQTVDSCVQSVAQALELAPDRLSVFGYAHMPSLKAHQGRIETAALPGATQRTEQAAAMAETLEAAGYVAIGLDHYARKDDVMATAYAAGRLKRNFQGYTVDTATALLGFGASAIGRTRGGYIQNKVEVPAYLKAWEAHEAGDGTGWAVAKGLALSDDDRLRADIIEQLMCRFSVDLSDTCRRHGGSLEEILTPATRRALAALADDDMIICDKTRVEVREEARPLVRSVAVLFDAYFDPESGRHSYAV